MGGKSAGEADPGGVDYWSKEWDRARALVDTCSDRANDIRKLGFALVSTSLTAEALVKYKAAEALGGPTGFVLLLVVLATLLGIRLYEKEMQLLRAAASSRARTLEMLAPVELTDAITDRHRLDDWPWYRSVVYAIFGLVGVAVSLAVSGPAAWVGPGIAAGLVYEGAIAALTLVDIKMPTEIDVAFDRVQCEVGDHVSILAVNLHDDAQLVNDPMFTIEAVPQLWLEPEAPAKDCEPMHVRLPVGLGFGPHHLRSLQAVTWVWKAPAKGVYVIRRRVKRDTETYTFRRMLRVLPKSPPAPDPEPKEEQN